VKICFFFGAEKLEQNIREKLENLERCKSSSLKQVKL